MKPLFFLLCMVVLPVTAAPRLVALGGDVTEIVYALGSGEQLVGRDSTSQRPAAATKLPDVGYLRQLNSEGILSLQPTLVLANGQAQPSQVLQQVEKVGVKVVTVPASPQLSVIALKVNTIAQALGKTGQAQPLLAQLSRQVAELGQPVPTGHKALYIMSNQGRQSLVAGKDTAADVVLRSAGLVNVMGQVAHYQQMSQEGIISAAPDLVIIDRQALQQMGGTAQLWTLPGLSLTPAGKAQRVITIDQMALLGFGIDTPQAILTLRHDVAESYAHKP
ncbi:hemin ABC transporter substrate-binding protein [Tatumella sp. TA1]|nr:ABC transporter substrate-binding protein [Rosenbergiella collisarenosi]MBT0721426.1 ABC transporter substrate-binding protein [Rosenbergiella collisarenosi]QGX92626.1 hemin ABC transporter substrate-binding protein [Tatumella sp. TA1]